MVYNDVAANQAAQPVLVRRLHVDLMRIPSACCRAGR
jgi:hypothetical protein